jgi:predicted nuclease of predicted toxin-antitoxin system
MHTIIVDENIPETVANYLNKKGFEVLCLSQDALKSSKDSVIAAFASKNGLPILTLDSDFAKLYHNIYRGKITVLLIKTNPTSAQNIISLLENSLEKIQRVDIENKLLIITKKRLRIIS